MTLKEFLEKNPEAVKEASKCNDINEFKDLTKKAGITFESEEKLSKAFDLIKKQDSLELTDDALNAVSGGASYRVIDSENVYINESTDEIYTTSTGKKV